MTGTQDQGPITEGLQRRLHVDMGHLYGPPRPPQPPRRRPRPRRRFVPRTWKEAAAAAATLFFLLLSAAAITAAVLLWPLIRRHG